VTSQKVFNSSNRSEATPPTSETVVLLRRPVFWSYIFASLIVGAGVGFGAWAAIARFDQVVLATGTLEQQAPVKEIKAPTNGVVQELHVKDAEAVQKDELLATFKPTVLAADLEALTKEKEALTKQNQIYEDALKGGKLADQSDSASLPQLRAELVKEIQYYQGLVTDKNLEIAADGEFNANQQKLLAASSPELQSRASAARLQIQKLEKQLSLVQQDLTEAQKLLAVKQDILEPLTRLAIQAEVKQRLGQKQQLTVGISQAKKELQNTMALSAKDVLTKITQNQKRVAQIDSQLKQAQLDNQNRIAEIDAKLTQAQQPYPARGADSIGCNAG